MKKINFNEFLNGNIVINCTSEEQCKTLINKCEVRNIKFEPMLLDFHSEYKCLSIEDVFKKFSIDTCLKVKEVTDDEITLTFGSIRNFVNIRVAMIFKFSDIINNSESYGDFYQCNEARKIIDNAIDSCEIMLNYININPMSVWVKDLEKIKNFSRGFGIEVQELIEGIKEVKNKMEKTN